MSPRQPIKLSYLDKSRMQHGGLINKHICEKKKELSLLTASYIFIYIIVSLCIIKKYKLFFISIIGFIYILVTARYIFMHANEF